MIVLGRPLIFKITAPGIADYYLVDVAANNQAIQSTQCEPTPIPTPACIVYYVSHVCSLINFLLTSSSRYTHTHGMHTHFFVHPDSCHPLFTPQSCP